MEKTDVNQMLRYDDSKNVPPNERWMSAVAGVILALIGLKRRSLFGLALLGGSGYLLYRAATGQDQLRALLNRKWESEATLLPPNEPPPISVRRGDEVMESSWESFPTSDPPSWAMGDREDT